MELFSSLPQSKPNYLAEYCQGGPENQDLPTLAGRLLNIGKVLVECWQNHPLYGKGLSAEIWSNPMVRLEVHHAPGPRYGSPVSFSLVRLREVGGEMADISRKLGNTLNWDFQLMPVQETDPVFGLPPQNQKVLGDWYLRIPRFWDFPNQAGLNYVARKRFKERFPLLKPILNEAMHRRRSTHRHLRKQDGKALASQGVGKLATKKAEFMQGVAKNPAWIKALAEANLLAEDVWTVANNELAPKDIDRLGSQLTLFNN